MLTLRRGVSLCAMMATHDSSQRNRQARERQSERFGEPPQHPSPAPLRPSGGGATDRRGSRRADREHPRKARCKEASRQTRHDDPDRVGHERSPPAGREGRARGRRAPGAPPGLRGRGADRAGASRAAAERHRAGGLGGGALRGARPSGPLHWGAAREGRPPAAHWGLRRSRASSTRPDGLCILRARRTSAAQVAGDGGPIADRASVRGGESVRPDRSAVRREPVSSPRRRRRPCAPLSSGTPCWQGF
jgi:hypothetical protein